MHGIELTSLALLGALAYALLLIHRLRGALARQAASLAAFEEFSGDWTWEQDDQFRFTAFRGGAYERFRLDMSALLGCTRWDAPGTVLDPQAMADHRAQCERHQAFHDFQYGLRGDGGAVRWFITSGFPLYDAVGRFVGYRGLAREDTTRFQAEEALRRSEQRLSAIAAGSPVPMFALDKNGRVILWNRGCEVVLGVAAGEMLGRRDVWRAFYGEARPVLAACVMQDDPLAAATPLYGERVRHSESIPGALEAEGFFPAIGGRNRWLAFVAAPMYDEHDRIVGAIETLQDVTERKLAEQQLEERSNTLRALIDNLPSGISLVDADFRVVTWNDAFLRLLDLPAELFYEPPVPLRDVLRFEAQRGEHGAEHPEETVARLMAELATPTPAELERARPDGTTLEIRASPMPGGGFVTIYSDVTARKAAEAAQRLQAAYLSAVLDHLPQGISVFDQNLRLKHWNARLAEILELPAEALYPDAGIDDIIRVPPARGEYGGGDADRQVRRRRELVRRFEAHSFEDLRPDGKAHLVEGRPMFVDGRIAGFVTTYTDITGRRRNERLLERQHADLEAAQRTAHIGSWRWPLGAARPEFSPELLRLLRIDALAPQQGVLHLLRRIAPEDRAAVREGIRRLRGEGERLDLVCRLGHGERRHSHLRLIATTEHDAAGRLTGYSGIAQDITELREAENALRASSEMLQTIFEQGPLPLALVRIKNEVLTMANRSWLQAFAPDPARAVGSTLGQIGIWPERELWQRLCEQLREAGSVENFEAELARRDGGRMICEISGRAVQVDGAPMLLASFVDVTGERRTRAEIEALNASLEERVATRTAQLSAANADLERAMSKLVQAEKLASLGGLVAGIAHELNTPLGNAATVAGALRERVERFHDQVHTQQLRRSTLQAFVDGCAEATHLLERNIERAALQVAHFKQVAVDQTSERRRRFDLRTTIEEVVGALMPQLKRSVHQVHIEVAAGIELDSYPGPLEQVVANLIENALTHAFDDERPGRVSIAAEDDGGSAVRLQISDDGCGMAAKVRDHAFDPFFTTRLGQGGSGLGLYIVFNLVQGILGGSIELDSETGAGTRFRIELPRQAPVGAQRQEG